MKPAQDAEHTWTIGESGGKTLFQNCFACEYVQKYTALEGATPMRFGPRPDKSSHLCNGCNNKNVFFAVTVCFVAFISLLLLEKAPL